MLSNTKCSEILAWMRANDFDLNRDVEYAALRFDLKPHVAQQAIWQARAVEMQEARS